MYNIHIPFSSKPSQSKSGANQKASKQQHLQHVFWFRGFFFLFRLAGLFFCLFSFLLSSFLSPVINLKQRSSSRLSRRPTVEDGRANTQASAVGVSQTTLSIGSHFFTFYFVLPLTPPLIARVGMFLFPALGSRTLAQNSRFHSLLRPPGDSADPPPPPHRQT